MTRAGKNIFALGLDAFNRKKLESIRGAEDYEFYGLLEPEVFVEAEAFRIDDLLARAERQLDAFGGSIDAIIAYMDFPASTMLPILCRRYGLPSASLESVLRCEHKYWSRVEQSRVIPEHIPRFECFDPFDEDAARRIGLPYPFWVKPVKSFGSHLGFRVSDSRELCRALAEIRARLPRLARPFDEILTHAEVPVGLSGIGGRYCLAETVVGGHQCTLEGARHRGELHIHGVVDSIHGPNRRSFDRYEYPSRIPARVRARMHEVVDRLLAHIEYDNATFNAELLWDAPRDRVWLVEVNTRIAQHHSDLFEKVDGISNHQVTVDVALGRRPAFPHRQGRFRRAAVFFLRRYDDARVLRVPTGKEIQDAENAVPGAIVKVFVSEGMRLSELKEEDSYSYAYAMIYIGGNCREELRRNLRRCVAALPFELTAED